MPSLMCFPSCCSRLPVCVCVCTCVCTRDSKRTHSAKDLFYRQLRSQRALRRVRTGSVGHVAVSRWACRKRRRRNSPCMREDVRRFAQSIRHSGCALCSLAPMNLQRVHSSIKANSARDPQRRNNLDKCIPCSLTGDPRI
jgi:hypothetical protein